jgi:hypothetical protein
LFITNRFKVQGLRFKVRNSEILSLPSGILRSRPANKRGFHRGPRRLYILLIFLLIPCTLYLIPATLPAANAATVTLSWDQNPESDIAGYKLHYGTVSGNYQYDVDVGNYTSCTISGLAEGTTYYFAATAYNSGNVESGLSEELAYTIPTLPSPPSSTDTDGDGILDNDELDIYGTDPDQADTDGDGINDGEELEYWGNNWNGDSDSDGIVNLLDADSDGDGYSDGEEIEAGTEPANNASLPQNNPQLTVYEDANDGTTDGWEIYDDTPSGAKISNIFDANQQSKVIELSGSGIDNGYRLLLENLLPWKNSSQFNIKWSHQFSEYFVIYIDLETTAGHRYIQYKPVDFSDYGTDEYIRIGIGSNAQDGNWHSYSRDLQADMEAAQPGAKILEVNGFLIRGSGKVDDILLRDPQTSSNNLIHIAASSGSGGAIVPFGDIAVVQGSNQTFNITPDTGYDVVEVLVDGSSVGAITEYTFQNVSADHTISANFEADATALSSKGSRGWRWGWWRRANR